MNKGFLLGILGSNAYLILKCWMVFWLTKLLQSKYAFRGFYVFIMAWMVIQAIQIAGILGLSLFHLLYPLAFTIFMLVCAAILFWTSRRYTFSYTRFLETKAEKIFFLVILIAIGLFWGRCLFFADFTWDAQTYGLPRLAIWLNEKSVLIMMPSRQLNLFVNEWNGELNNLAYALISGSYVGFNFGALEILIVFFIAVAWVASLLGASRLWSLCMTAILSTTPAIFGLASTVKGDLLSCTASLLTFGWLLMLFRERQPALSFLFLILSAALAVGSKMSTLFVVLVLCTIGCFGILKYRTNYKIFWHKISWTGWISFFVMLFCFSSRFWINAIQLGNPVKRVESEAVQFNVLYVVDNVKLLIEKLFNVVVDYHAPKWALASGMSLSVWFIIIFGLLLPIGFAYKQSLKKINQKENFYKKISITGIFILASLIFTMMLVPGYVWNFRYFLPTLLILLLIIGCFFPSYYKYSPSLNHTILFAGIILTLMNLAFMFKWGEIFPIFLKSKIVQADTPLKRAILFVALPFTQVPVKALGLDDQSSKKILIFNDINTPLLPFIGSYAQNKIRTVAQPEDLLSLGANKSWDMVVILQEAMFRNPKITEQLINMGYTVLVKNFLYLIAVPNHRVKLELIKKFNDLTWKSNPENNLNKLNKFLTLYQSGPSFVAYPSLRKKEAILIKARFEGEIAGVAWKAANLSLCGQEDPFLKLMTGKYKPTEPFYGITEISEGGCLIYSLGNWNDDASMRLVELEMYRFALVP